MALELAAEHGRHDWRGYYTVGMGHVTRLLDMLRFSEHYRYLCWYSLFHVLHQHQYSIQYSFDVWLVTHYVVSLLYKSTCSFMFLFFAA
jgi:hypothetical protein